MATVVVTRHAVEALRRGHPWVYDSAVTSGGNHSQIVSVVDGTGERLGAGVHDPSSPIAVRVWVTGPDARLDAATFRTRLERAIEIRRVLFPASADPTKIGPLPSARSLPHGGGETTAYRLLNGEGDRTPGVVIDRYDDVAVLRLDGDAVRAVAPTLLEGLEPALRAIGITTLLERLPRDESESVRVRFGPPRELVKVREHGVPFEVDLVNGQKTGAFLDQRENRRRVGELVAERVRADRGVRVLNLFSYAGGFSLRAALAGGTVTSVDIAARAHATAMKSFRHAGVDPRAHEFVTADAFAWLDAARAKGARYDVVISDPPSFAPSEKKKPRALTAYRALHRACAAILAPGGHLVAASCSSHVTAEDFAGTLDDGALGRDDLRLLDLFGPPPDHPTLPSFPEGRYLKLALLA